MLDPKEHIINHLNDVIRDEAHSFPTIYNLIEREGKEKYRSLLLFLDKILEHGLENSETIPAYYHIHFEGSNGQGIPWILEFVIIKFFLRHYLKKPCDPDSKFVSENIQYLKRILKREFDPGQDVSAKSRAFKKAQEQRNNLRTLCKFYEKLKEIRVSESGVFKPKVLLNVLKREQISAQQEFKYRPFTVPVKEFDLSKTSYVILNSDKDRDDLDKLDFSGDYDLLNDIEDVIIFNCEGRSIHKGFNISSLEEMNREGENFKNLIVFSFSNDPQLKLNRLISHLDRVETNYNLRPKGLRFSSYVILPDELNSLMKGIAFQKVEIKFIETDDTFCQVFQEQLNEHEELYELYSIKMRNIYSLCLKTEIKEIILKEIFAPGTESPRLISEETKRYLLELDDEYISDLRNTLDNILDLVISQNLSDNVRNFCIDRSSRIIIPSAIFEHKNFSALIKQTLNLSKNIILSTWDNIEEAAENQLIILDYRDTGKFPFQISPNIHELYLCKDQDARGIFYGMFFKHNYEFTYYEYHRILFSNILDHPFRKEYFKWEKLLTAIDYLRPQKQHFDHLWDMENSYEFSNREVVIISYSEVSKSYWPSQLFIVSTGGECPLYTDRAENLKSELELGDIMKVQPIEEIYKDLNLFETTEQEESELLQMKRKYDLKDDELEQRLWKILLKRKVETKGLDQVYSDLENKIQGVGAKNVSRNYFENTWLDPQSDSLIPRSKRVFKVLCQFLELPRVYYVVMLKKRAKERLASKKSTSKMNRLIADLIHEGLFDPDHSEDESCSFDDFFNNHDLEEIGMTKENYEGELTSLVELLKPYLDLKEVKKIELRKL